MADTRGRLTALRQAGAVRKGERRHRASIHGRDQTIDGRKVQQARQRLAAGHYDRADVLDVVLNAVLADLAEPPEVDALQAVEVGGAP